MTRLSLCRKRPESFLLSSSAFSCLHSFLLQTGTHMLVHLIAIPLGSDHGCIFLTCADLTLPTSTSGLHSPCPSTLDLLLCFCYNLTLTMYDGLPRSRLDSYSLQLHSVRRGCRAAGTSWDAGMIVTSGIKMTQTFLSPFCVAVIAWYVSRDVLLLDVLSFSCCSSVRDV